MFIIPHLPSIYQTINYKKLIDFYHTIFYAIQIQYTPYTDVGNCNFKQLRQKFSLQRAHLEDVVVNNTYRGKQLGKL